MAVGGADVVCNNIVQEILHLSPTISEYCIFKLHHQLRKMNEEAYEPATISIGPYHHGKDKQRPMEEHKLRYLQFLLQRTNETNLDRYESSMRNLVERARKCYAELTFLDDDMFVKMMLLDRCFIIELFRRIVDVIRPEMTDPIFSFPWLPNVVRIDILLLENQLPFFVLEELFNMTKSQNENSLIDLALSCFEGFCGTKRVEGVKSNPMGEVRHLLGLIHWSRVPAVATMKQETGWKLTRFISCATELREAGIRFKKGSVGCIFNVNFTNGVMEIPPLTILDETRSCFRNLTVYEQYDYHMDHYYFTDYLTFFDLLINSPKDVELLRQTGSISNWLGDDEVISIMFNKLGDNVAMDDDNFYYSDIFATVNDHCSKKRNKYLAKLRHNYFNSPWSVASFLAAVAILLLTVTQTLFSILSYVKQ